MHIAHIDPEGKLQTCTEHCRAVAARARASLTGVGFPASAELAGLLHDCGKFTEAFDSYIRNAVAGNAKKGSVIHSFAGAYYFLKKRHGTDADISFEDITSEILASAIASHHGLIDVVDENRESGFEHRLTAQPAYEEGAVRSFIAECAGEEELSRLFRDAAVEVRRFYMDDPLTQDETELYFYTGLLTRLITSAVVDGDRTDTADFMSGHTLPAPRKADRAVWGLITARITDFLDAMPREKPIAQARRDFSDACLAFADRKVDIYRLNLPTGGGKTIASFRYAAAHAEKYGKERIFYIAPLLTILEQNAGVIRSLVQDDTLVLEHHSDVVNDGMTEEELSAHELLTETWDAPVIVTTMVQLLNTLFSGKMPSVRRFHALCNSVIIFDEVQSVPREDISLFNLAMNFLSGVCHATVILCSATQPCFEATDRYRMLVSGEQMVPDALLKQHKHLFDRTEISYGGRVTLAQLPAAVREAMRSVDSLLIVCNTKEEAAGLFRSLDAGDTEMYFLSAGLCRAHRKKVLDALYASLKERRRLICVSTQVIEAGVDISFQSVIRVLAGLDSVVQSAGRCNRSREYAGRMPVSVYDVSDEKLGDLEQIKDAQYALRDLIFAYQNAPERFSADLASDEAIAYYYRQLFRKLEQTQGLTEHPLENRPSLLELLSRNTRYAAETEHQDRYYMRQAFKTGGRLFSVFDEDTLSVIVPYEEGAGIIDQLLTAKEFGRMSALLRQAKDYTVTVYANAAEKLLEAGAIRSLWDGHIYILDPVYYDAQTGIQRYQRKEMMECSTLIL